MDQQQPIASNASFDAHSPTTLSGYRFALPHDLIFVMLLVPSSLYQSNTIHDKSIE